MTNERFVAPQSYLHSLPRHAVYNVLGLLLPLPVGLINVPGMIDRFGEDRFGLLALAWILIGYFSLFDFGIARALTKAITDLVDDDSDNVSRVIWTGLILILCLGVIGGLLIVSVGYSLPLESIQNETISLSDYRSALALTAIAVPFVLLTAGLRAVFEAYHMFDTVNYLRVPIGMYNFIAPWAVSFYSTLLSASIAAILIGRIIFSLVHWIVLRRKLGHVVRVGYFERAVSGRLLRFGGWLTLSNIVSPLLTYLDRFLVGAMLSAAAITYYVAPYEIAARVLVVPAALAGVLFPAMSRVFAEKAAGIQKIYSSSVGVAYLFLLSIAILSVILSDWFFLHWLGPEFVHQSSAVYQILMVGVMVNGIARIPFALVQAAGRPDLSAKLHLLELPVFVVVLILLLSTYGIIGAAIAWSLRVGVDLLGLFYLAGRVSPETRGASVETCVVLALAAVCAYVISLYSLNVWVLAGGLGIVVFNGLVVWKRYLGESERTWVRGKLRNFSILGKYENGAR